MIPSMVLVTLGALLGAAMGSFAALLAERTLRDEPVIWARSECRDCKAHLGTAELIPVLSYLWQRGRCSRCDARIPPVLFQAELTGAALGIGAVIVSPDPLRALVLGLWMWALLALAIADLRAFRLPDRLLLLATAAGAAWVWLGDGTGWPPLADRMQGAALGALVGGGSFWLIRVTYRLTRGRDGMGLGDVKLMAVLGMVLGIERLPLMVLLAAVSTLALSVLRSWRRGRPLNRLGRAPFGAALALASAVLMLL